MHGLVALPARATLPARPLRRGSHDLPLLRQRHQQQHAAPHQHQHKQRLQPVAALPEALAALQASPARDVAAAAFAVAGSVALIKFFDTLERFQLIDKVGCWLHMQNSGPDGLTRRGGRVWGPRARAGQICAPTGSPDGRSPGSPMRCPTFYQLHCCSQCRTHTHVPGLHARPLRTCFHSICF